MVRKSIQLLWGYIGVNDFDLVFGLILSEYPMYMVYICLLTIHIGSWYLDYVNVFPHLE